MVLSSKRVERKGGKGRGGGGEENQSVVMAEAWARQDVTTGGASEE